ncbi:MFS transporter [Chloroflexota bacterium]
MNRKLGVKTIISENSPNQKTNRFFYGWVIVATTTVIMTLVYGSNYTFSVFLKVLAKDFGWTRAATSGPFAISLWTSGLLSILMGALTDRYGPKIVIALASLVGGLGYLLLSSISTLWQLYVGYILISVNISATWTPIMATVSRWFTKKRVLALGIVTGGIGLGQMLMPPLAAYLIETNGWRTTYIILAVLIWIIVVPAAIPTRHSPREKSIWSSPDLSNNARILDDRLSTMETVDWSYREAMRTSTFWSLMALNILLAATFFMASIHVVAYATDFQIATTLAATLLTFMGGANILSKIFVGAIAARYGSRKALFIFFICIIVALFAFAIARDYWMFCIIASIFGFGIGGAAPPLTSMVSEFFGLRSLGIVMGFLGVGWAAGCALGTFMGDYIFDISGSYIIAFTTGGALAIMAAIIVLSLRTPERSRES